MLVCPYLSTKSLTTVYNSNRLDMEPHAAFPQSLSAPKGESLPYNSRYVKWR